MGQWQPEQWSVEQARLGQWQPEKWKLEKPRLGARELEQSVWAEGRVLELPGLPEQEADVLVGIRLD